MHTLDYTLLIPKLCQYIIFHSMPPKKENNKNQTQYLQPIRVFPRDRQKVPESQSLTKFALPQIDNSEKSAISLLNFSLATKKFQDPISTFSLGKTLPDHIFLNKTLSGSIDPKKDGEEKNFLEVLKIRKTETGCFENQMLDQNEEPERQKYEIVTENIFPNVPLYSKITTASNKITSLVQRGFNLNPQASETIITSSDSIIFYQYQLNTLCSHLPMLMKLSLERQDIKSGRNHIMSSIPTSFDYSEHCISPEKTFYSTNINGILAKWDLTRAKASLFCSLSKKQLHDISMNRDMYAVACQDGRIIIGCENNKILDIKEIKERNKIWKQQKFIRVKWLDQYYLASSSVKENFLWKQHGGNEGGKIYIFDVRYVKKYGGVVETIPQTEIYPVLETGDPEKYNLNYFTREGYYSNTFHQGLNNRFLETMISSLFSPGVVKPKKFEDEKYIENKVWENICISSKWRILGTQNEIFCFGSEIQSTQHL